MKKTYNLYLKLLFSSIVMLVQSTEHFQVVENSPTNSEVGRVHTSSEINSNYSFAGGVDCGFYFNINPESSLITVLDQSNLDREAIVQSMQTDTLNCLVTSSLASTTIHTPVTIEVLDVNDCVPYFFGLSQAHSVNVVENVAIPTPVLRLQPIDCDKGENGTTQFNITSGNQEGYFRIDLAEGDTAGSTSNRILFLIRSINFEDLTNGGVFNLTITITDMAPPAFRLSFEQIIIINVVNLEDEPPTFEATSYTFNVTENHPVGSQEVFARVLAGSDQSSGQVFYNICSACHHEPEDVITIIGVNQVTGGLFLRVPVDFESLQDPSFLFEVIASDPNTRETVTTSVTVDVLDINEHPPYFVCLVNNLAAKAPFVCSAQISVNNSEFYIEENSTISSTLLFNFQVSDDDLTSDFQEVDRTTIGYHIEPETHSFISQFALFGSSTVFFMQLVSGSTFDREQILIFSLTLTVENIVSPRLRSVSTVTIRVLDINDNYPQFVKEQFEGYISEGSPVDMEIVRVAAHDPDQGENGTVIYSISDIQEEVARDWFQISRESGMISVKNISTNYLDVEGSVSLTITATDNGTDPLHSSVIVVVSILPSITFISGSYQEYSGIEFNLFAENTSFYFEFRSSESSGLLAYQQHPSTGAVFSVELQQTGIAVRSNAETMYRDVNVATDSWNSVHIQLFQGQVINLTIFEVDSSSDFSRLALLQDLIIQMCSNYSQQLLDHHSSLYIGGVNVFILPPNTTVRTPTFVGGIRNVVVKGVSLDLDCPATEVNTVRGVVRSNGCEEMCSSSNRTTQCVDYAEEPYCQCLGGFPPQVCSISNEMQSYVPIQFHGSTKIKLSLGYSFFYYLEVQKASEGRVAVASQVVEIRFRLLDQNSAVILCSRTTSSVHLIGIGHNSREGTTSLKYIIWNHSQLQTPAINLSIDSFPFQNQTEYTARAATDTDAVTLTLSDRQVQQEWNTQPVTLFAEQPETNISIGGADNNTDLTFGYFVGCISHVSIDEIELPLSGLLSTPSEEGGFKVEDLEGVANYCDLCDLTVCPEHATCLSDRFGGVECDFQDNLVPATTDDNLYPVTSDTIPTSVNLTVVGGILGSVAIILILIILVVPVIILCFRSRMIKHHRKGQVDFPMIEFNVNSMHNQYQDKHPKLHPTPL